MIIKSKGYMHKLSNETQVAILSVFVLAMLAVFPFQIMIAGIIMGSLLYTAGGSALGGIGIGWPDQWPGMPLLQDIPYL